MQANHHLLVGGVAEALCSLAPLRIAMPGMSHKVLTQQLGELMNDGIVRREPKGAVPAPVMYSLTEYGSSVLPLVENVRLWGRSHLERFDGSPE
jgi:DNA-binding HxlR family transcriptional regulator